jgi:hypothetical protein
MFYNLKNVFFFEHTLSCCNVEKIVYNLYVNSSSINLVFCFVERDRKNGKKIKSYKYVFLTLAVYLKSFFVIIIIKFE